MQFLAADSNIEALVNDPDAAVTILVREWCTMPSLGHAPRSAALQPCHSTIAFM